MSLDPENRSAINNFLDMRRVQVNINQLLLNNTCSFCGVAGHNIRTCNDSRITDFELECMNAKTLCSIFVEPVNSFKLWLIDYYLDGINGTLVKAFAIRKCHCRISTTPDILIQRIISYFYDDVFEEEEDECAICYEDAIPQTNSVTLNCNHEFCKDCFIGCLKNTPSYKELPSCALCRGDINTITVYSESVKGELDDYLSV